MSTKAEQDTLRLLVQHVLRAFYETKYSIVIDQLSRHKILKDEDLASRVGMNSKELNKVMAILQVDGIVETHQQNELREGAQRAVLKKYYYIDYRRACNVIKWRIAEMRRQIDNTLRNELDNKGYLCPQCKASYAPLDVDKLFNMERQTFVCEICGHEVIENDSAESLQGSQDRMMRFNHQMRFIREGLRKTEDMVLPAFDAAALVRFLAVEAARSADPTLGDLKVAGSGPSTHKDDGVGIVMSMDKDENTRRLEREAQAEAKRQQNAMPAWHLASTVSGDMTALGVKEAQRAAAKAAQLQASNLDETLKGLGTVGSSSAGETKPVVNVITGEAEDVKPVINPESDYYDRYYASLAASASSGAISTLATPPGLADSDGEDDDEDQATPASTEYLTSLNDYRKRSRSREDDGPTNNRKLAKTVNGVYGDLSAPEIASPALDVEEIAVTDDPMVQVNGIPKAFSEVTEEDQELMTPEEYTAYFEVFQART